MMLPSRKRAARTAGAALLLLSLVTWPLAGQATGGGIFDSLALAKLLAPIKNGPKTPQPVLLAFAEDGSLDRLAISDSVSSELRNLLRDSLPRVVRTDSAFASLRVRLFLVSAKPLMLVPACEELPPQFLQPTSADLERALEAPQLASVKLESRPLPAPRAFPNPAPARASVAMVVLPGGRVAGATVSGVTSAARSGPRALEMLTIQPAPGASWSVACLFRSVVQVGGPPL